MTLAIGRDGASLRGVAGDGVTTYTAMSTVSASSQTVIEARRHNVAPLWRVELDGQGGPIANVGELVVATLAGTGSLDGTVLRGEPGGVVVGITAGAVRWRLAIDASEWVVIAAIAPAGDGVIVGGSFAGTLRAGATSGATANVVSSAGKSDGFVARVDARGQVVWLVRTGGDGADAIQGVAAADGRVAIAGTFSVGAELAGQPLVSSNEKSPLADGFVALLDPGGKPTWLTTFGGPAEETVAGVAIDDAGRIAVIGSVRDTMHVAGTELTAVGPSDGLVAWWTAEGAAGGALKIGGLDFDGLRAIIAVDHRFVVAGFFSGTLPLGGERLTAGGGDDAFVAAIDPEGGSAPARQIPATWQVGGEGREEVVALAPVPGGFVAGVTHTASASFEGAPLPSPKDPMSGAAIVVRSVIVR